MSPAHSDLLEALVQFRKYIDRAAQDAQRIGRVLDVDIAALRNGLPVARLGTSFGCTDLAAMVNTASRWEGRVGERLEVAYETEARQEAEDKAIAANL